MVSLKAPALWTGWSRGEVPLRSGPGVNYPVHESGDLLDGERIYVLEECHGWLLARVVSGPYIDRVIQENGAKRAREMLLFWVQKENIRR